MAEPVRKSAPRKRVSRRPAVQSLDPVEIALARDRDDTAGVLLERQIALIEQQTVEARLHGDLIRQDLAHRRWELTSLRFTVLLKALTVAVGLAVATMFSVMIWRASQADGLVVQAFTVPADMAAQGMTGEVIAARVLDRLATLTRQTDSGRPAGTFTDDWTRDVSIEIPQTNISISELDRSLRQLLGHETRLTGAVARTPGGLSIAARTGPGTGILVTGSEDELDALIDRTAVALFARTQPYRYAVSLMSAGRADEAALIFRRLMASGPKTERAWAAIRLGTMLQARERPAEAKDVLQQAISWDPDNSTAYWTLANAEAALGHPGAADRQFELAIAALRRGRDGLVEQSRRQRTLLIRSQLASSRGATADAYDLLLPVIADPPAGAGFSANITKIGALLSLHDLSGARALLLAYSPTTLPEVASRAGLEAQLLWHMRDWTALDLAAASLRQGGFSSVRPLMMRALAAARLGRVAEARALLAATPLDHEGYVETRGIVETFAGDRARAEYWFAQAIRLAPERSQTHVALGEARLAFGDLTAAQKAFEAAARLQPRSPDALFGLGKTLMAMGKAQAAVAKFAAAAELSPRWGENRLYWAEALKRSGDMNGARTQAGLARQYLVPKDAEGRLAAIR